jgi:redox-sensing transcriptional repressor
MRPKVSESTVRRLSIYLRRLDDLHRRGVDTVSSQELARGSGATPAQVRKDLSFFGSFGKRGLGYPVEELRARLRAILGLEREWQVVVVGAGRIGTALAGYPAFRAQGFRVVALVDADPAKVGTRAGGVPVRGVDDLGRLVAEEGVEIGIIATPAEAAQEVADRLVAAGVRGILNFAPAELRVPPGVALKTVNMALELESLSFALTNGVRARD